MKFKILFGLTILLYGLVLISCERNVQGEMSAKSIIDSSIVAHGGKNYQHMDVSFTFREYRVRLRNENGKFNYSRRFTDTSGNHIEDVLNNEGFNRKINDTMQSLTGEKNKSLSSSINSVAYFALLPYKLKEPAVVAERVGDTTFNNQQYYKISVSFKAEGKQNDHQDDYCYWMNKKNFHIDYLSYKTGGPRMRKAIGEHTYGGILFQDYDNYAMKDSNTDVKNYDRYLLEGKMMLISKIENSNFVDNLK